MLIGDHDYEDGMAHLYTNATGVFTLVQTFDGRDLDLGSNDRLGIDTKIEGHYLMLGTLTAGKNFLFYGTLSGNGTRGGS